MNTQINYNQIANKYDSTRTSNTNTIDLFQRKIDFTKETRVLDFGCGTGNFLKTISEKFECTCYGVEPSDSMRELAIQKNQNSQIKKGSHESIPFADNFFDFIYMTDVIHHIPYMDKLFMELNRVLKQSGLLCIVTESHKQIKNRFYNKYFPSLKAVELNRYPDITDIIDNALKNSLIVEEVKEKENFKTRITENFVKLVSEKGYSMFRLITEEEHKKGLEKLISDYKSDIELKTSSESLIWLKKN